MHEADHHDARLVDRHTLNPGAERQRPEMPQMPVGLTDEPRVEQRVRRAKSRCGQTRTLVSTAIEADPVAGALTQRQPQAFSISALSVEISRHVRGTSGYFPGRGALLAVEAALPAPQLATRIVRVIHAAPRADGAPRRIRRSSLRSQPKLELHGGAHQQHGQKAGGITSRSCARPVREGIRTGRSHSAPSPSGPP